MARLQVTADNRLVGYATTPDPGVDQPEHAALKQSYDGGWTVASGTETAELSLPSETFQTRDELIQAIVAHGHEVDVEPTDRTGSGQ